MKENIWILAIGLGLILANNCAAQNHQNLFGLSKWIIAKQTTEHPLSLYDAIKAQTISLFPEPTACITPSQINFNPSYHFNACDEGLSLPIDKKSTSTQTCFVVAIPTDVATERTLWILEQKGQSKLVATTQRVADLMNYKYLSSTKPNNQPAIWTYFGDQRSNDSTDFILRIGAKPRETKLPPQGFKGDIAEILFFDRALPPKKQQQIESYLAIKYGVTLVGDYLNSLGAVVWDTRANQPFSHNIAGLGRDDFYGLYQKQACGTTSKPLLAIGMGDIYNSNEENPATLSNHAFLLWAENGELPFFETETHSNKKILLKKWKINASGQYLGQKAVLRFDPSQLGERAAQGEDYCLLIDRSGKGDFSGNQIDTANAKIEGAYLVFRDIQWDTDSSGSDSFTLAIRKTQEQQIYMPPDCFESVEHWPNPSIDGHFQVAVKLKQSALLQIMMVDVDGRQISNLTLPVSDRFFFNAAIPPVSGLYHIVLMASNGVRTLPLVIP